MEVAKLVLEYLKVLAWPIFAAAVLFGFRQSARRLLSRITEFDGLGVSAKFEQRVSELAEEASAIEDATAASIPADEQVSPPSDSPFPSEDPGFAWATMGTEADLRGGFDGSRVHASNNEPQVAIAFAWSQLASVLDEVGQAAKVTGLSRADSSTWSRRLRELRAEGGTAAELAPKISQLHRLRNEALHSPHSKLSRSAAFSFIDAAEDLAVALLRVLRSGTQEK